MTHWNDVPAGANTTAPDQLVDVRVGAEVRLLRGPWKTSLFVLKVGGT